MRKTDKNIAILTIIALMSLTVWSINRYDIQKKHSAQSSQNLTTSEETSTEISREQQKTNNEEHAVIPLLTAHELSAKMITNMGDTTIIDMRPYEAYEKGHIKGSYHATNISPDTMRRNVILVTEDGNEDTIMAYYRDIAHNSTVYNLSGGINQWKNAGLGMISVSSEHTFENASKVHFIEPRDIDTMMKNLDEMEKMIILDTRRAGNYEKSHVTNAINIPLSELEYRSNELPFAKKIIVYGANDATSFQAGILLYDLGFINTKTMKGGFDAWVKYGYPITQ